MTSSGPSASRLVAWFLKNRRDLPWRREPRDAYAVWVSEVMLQQTQAVTVAARFDAFLARFPDVHALAAASEQDVLKAWEGLGYYRRARMLHAGAKHVVTKLGGALPTTFKAWLDVPGVGAYTAGAIASLAYNQRVPAVDGNVLRVVARVRASPLDVASAKTRDNFAAWVLEHLLPRGVSPRMSPALANEALIELGATVCTPKNPKCGACPFARACLARASGMPEAWPRKARKGDAPTRVVAMALLRRGDLVWLVRQPDDGLLGGTWGLPHAEAADGEDPADALRARLHELGVRDARVPDEALGTTRHAFSHKRWDVRVYAVDATPGLTENAGWRRPKDVAVATAFQKALALARFA